MRFGVRVLDVTDTACRSEERDERSKLGSRKLSFGQYDKEWHGHLEITRGNETCLEDVHDASRLNLYLGYEVCAEPEALDKHGHRDELRFPYGSVT